MLKALTTFLTMVATTCLIFAAVGILTWRMALAVLVGSVIGAALARVKLTPGARRPLMGTPAGPGSTQ